jgi:hypothetical protein
MGDGANAALFALAHWHTGTAAVIALAELHCTLGDVLIASVALVAALAVVGSFAWPNEKAVSVAVAVVIVAASYTVYSEYLNISVRKSWTYTEWMPTLPWFGTGLAPLAQWAVVPALALAWASFSSGSCRDTIRCD